MCDHGMYVLLWMCNSQVPGMHVMEEEQSSTILTAGAEGFRGGIVTNEICQ